SSRGAYCEFERIPIALPGRRRCLAPIEIRLEEVLGTSDENLFAGRRMRHKTNHSIATVQPYRRSEFDGCQRLFSMPLTRKQDICPIHRAAFWSGLRL